MEMREVLSREGREAKNLLVYQFCDETTGNGAGTGVDRHGGVVVNGDCYSAPTCRKPPVAPPKSPNGQPKHCQSPTTTLATSVAPMRSKSGNASISGSNGPRVRSASTGRDKKSELQARYWALLFGNLQRAVNEIYQTVECYENISSCQEAILVLENYVRDFKALSEWFKVSWDYDSRPLQQRPQSLAWEIRKSNPTPRVRAKSLCSPTTSGKSSPALIAYNSGKTSPCCDGHLTPKKLLRACDQLPRGAMRLNVRELFASNKPRNVRGSPNSDSQESQPAAQLEPVSGKPYVQFKNQYSQTDLEDPHLTLADVREKMQREAAEREAAARQQAAKETAEREAAERQAAERKAAERQAAEMKAAAQQAAEMEVAAQQAAEMGAAAQQAAEMWPAAQQAAETEAAERLAAERVAAQKEMALEVEQTSAKDVAAAVKAMQPPAEIPVEPKQPSNQAQPQAELSLPLVAAVEPTAVQPSNQAQPQAQLLPPVAAVKSTALQPSNQAQPQAGLSLPPVAAVEPTAVQLTINSLDAMENALLSAQTNKDPTPPSTLLKPVAPLPEKKLPMQQLANVQPGGNMQNNQLKYSSVLNRPVVARGVQPKSSVQPSVTAAAGSKFLSSKPKTVMPINVQRRTFVTTNNISNNNSSYTSNTSNASSSNNSNAKSFTVRNPRLPTAQPPPRPASKTECYGPPNNVATRLSARSRTMLDMNGNAIPAVIMPKPSLSKRVGSTYPTTSTVAVSSASSVSSVAASASASGVGQRPSAPIVGLSSREDIASSTSTLKASNEQLSSSRSTLKLDEPHSEPKQQTTTDANDGWLTVKNRRRTSMHWSNRFNQPTGYASLPTLALLNEQMEEQDKQQREKAAAAEATATATAAAAAAAAGPATASSKSQARAKYSITGKVSGMESKAKAGQKTAKMVVAPAGPRPEIKNAKAKVNSFPVQRTASNLKKQEKDQDKHKDKEADKNKDKQADKNKDKEADKNKDKQADKNKDKEADKNKDKEADKNKDKDKDKCKEKCKDKGKDKDKEKEKEKDAENVKGTDNDKDKHSEKDKEKNKDKDKEKTKSKSAIVLPRSNSNALPTATARTSTIKRQKSDLTGLKMTSLHKEYMRSEKNALRKQQKEQQKSSIDAGTANESNNDDHSKIDIKIQTNCEFSKTIGELYESIARCNLPNGCVKPPSASMLSSCDEIEEQSAEDVEEERNERMLVEVQESLERQIRELESTEIDVDTETDETDCEVQLEEQDDNTDEGLDDAVVFVTMSDDENASLELRYQALLSDMSWNERAEALATLQAYVARHPGRAQELHQKLSSPSRRRSLQETLKKYQAKQARAQQKRALLQQEKAAKLQQLFVRVEDVKAAKKQLIEDKRLKMEGRLQRAAENRELYLRQIIEKAHDEDKKLKEINFIKNIEAQNKRLDLLESFKETEGRLQDLEQERQKRVEEKAAKEAAVERRRQALEKERQLKLEKMNETRLEKEQRIGKMQEQKERQRQALAREKARDREERLLALQVQQQQTTEELQRKILQKQLESARRHEENIEHIRQRALELTLPGTRQQDDARGDDETELVNGKANSTSNEDCDLSSALSDVGGVAGSHEHSRSFKKKMKKLKQRMNQSAIEYMSDIDPLPVHVKRESSVPKLLNLVMRGGGAQGLERTLGNLLRLIPKAQTCDFMVFLSMDGLGVLANYVISKGLEDNSDISKKSVTLAVQLYRNTCSVCPQVARHALLGNSIATLFDAIRRSFQLRQEKSPHNPVELSTELMLACTEALSASYVKKYIHPKVPERLPDMINYAVSTGLIGMLARRCMKVRESMELNHGIMLSMLTTLGFLTRFVDVCPSGPADPTRLLSTAKSTELFGTVAMLSACVVPIGGFIPPRTTALVASTFNLYISLASMDLNTFQEVLSVEGPLPLKLLDLIVMILGVIVKNKEVVHPNGETSTMLIDMIASLAFFSVNNRRHQELLLGEPYNVIFKHLSKLSVQFNPVTYPFLVTLYNNNPVARQIISKEFDMEFVEAYRLSDAAKRNRLIQIMNGKVGMRRNSSGNNSNNSNSNNNKSQPK